MINLDGWEDLTFFSVIISQLCIVTCSISSVARPSKKLSREINVIYHLPRHMVSANKNGTAAQYNYPHTVSIKIAYRMEQPSQVKHVNMTVDNFH